ncbi:MAG: hypothetical protein NTW87_19835 [Planctomycetota bacterium]|nr:hypothetical protein [Planctomycetota bacterium]
MEQKPYDRSLFAAAHPRAARWCAYLRQTMNFCSRAILVIMKACVILLFACFLMEIVSRGKLPGAVGAVVGGVPVFVFAACVVGYILAGFLRLLLIALFFLRYSLGQLMSVVLLWGAGLTLAVKLPGEWKALPITALVLLVLLVLMYIAAHDPEDPLFTPEFVRRTLGPRPVSADEADQQATPPVGRVANSTHGEEEQAKDG